MPVDLAPGSIVAERYRIEALLGEGGMGAVYRAEHVHMRKTFALKVLLPEWSSTPEVLARFEREAIAAGRIAHPNVATATDFGRLADGSFFLVLELVRGRTLRTELEAGAIEPARALRIARGVAAGIGAAHALGIVHRDLKPENVMLVERDGDPDFVKVLDFGIAKVTGPDPRGGPALTSAGAILGTPEYMAPEQALGEAIDARVDLYALGVILFEMLTGKCPFEGGAVTLLRRHVLEPAPAIPAELASRVPLVARSILEAMLQKQPSARPASADAVIAAIDAALAPPVVATPALAEAAPLPLRAAPRAPARRPGVWIVAAVGALALLLALLSSMTSSNATSPTSASTAWHPLPPPPKPGTTAASATTTATPPPTDTPTPAASSTDETPTEIPPPPRPSSSALPPPPAKHRRTGPGGIYIPPPSQWFR